MGLSTMILQILNLKKMMHDDDEPAAKKGRKEEIQWKEQKVYVLVCACKAEKRILKRKKDYL